MRSTDKRPSNGRRIPGDKPIPGTYNIRTMPNWRRIQLLGYRFLRGVTHRWPVIIDDSPRINLSFPTAPLGTSGGITSVAYKRVLILHDQPSTAPLHHHKGPDTSFILVPDSIGSNECARPARDRHNRHIGTGKPHRKVFDSGGNSFQKSRVYLLQFLEDRISPKGPSAKRIN